MGRSKHCYATLLILGMSSKKIGDIMIVLNMTMSGSLMGEPRGPLNSQTFALRPY